MASYRIYFLTAGGRIEGREDFEAMDNGVALTIADRLYEACSDTSPAYELWKGTDCLLSARVDSPARPSPSLAQVTAQMQESLLLKEEAISRSQWRIAHSKRLLARIERLRAELARGV
jgi:hypothetical protein